MPNGNELHTDTDASQAGPAPVDLPKLVVILPALNEAATIGDVIGRIPRTIDGVGPVDVIVVDDGSTDDTAKLAAEAGAQVVRHRRNLGVGRAFATGIDAALRRGADVIVNMDSDGQFDPGDIPPLIRPILDDGYGFVTCTRFGDPQYVPDMPWVKKWGNRMMCRLINWIIWKADFTDVSCGFRAYTRDTALRLNLFGEFTYTQESFIDLAAKRVAMTEVPLRVRGTREFGTSRVASNLWRYAFQTVPIILRAMRDARPMKFFGMPALILLLLGLMQAAFVAGWWLATGQTSPWRSLVVIGASMMILGTGLGITALVADQLGRMKRTQDELARYGREAWYRGSAIPAHERLHTPGDDGPEVDHSTPTSPQR